ncbi:MAG: hypothetical protein WCX65_02145 [bacterium]
MKSPASETAGTPIWFKTAIVVFAAASLIFFYMILRPKSDPAAVLNNYVNALARGRCGKAYKFVSYYAKNNSVDYSTYDKFERSVCAPAAGKYIYLEMISVVNKNVGSDTATIAAMLKFKTSWMPRSQSRMMQFDFRKERGDWLLEGPELLP